MKRKSKTDPSWALTLFNVISNPLNASVALMKKPAN